MDRFESMTVLAAVVDAGSFSGAGRALRMPVANESRKVAELEAHLKVRLLRRSIWRYAWACLPTAACCAGTAHRARRRIS